ncbi:MAG: Wzz/FepE/Etk N-terminal domain-containing protein [Opitutaceae bacterium]|nr:Wzz/FepE/Etk N-terminal domain-containing protein [Opitutaceae bacterium]
MNNPPIPAAQNLDLGDIYYILFRHKWKIILCSLAGIGAAVALYRTENPPFQSEAKLLVRYIVQGTTPTRGPTETTKSTDERGGSIMNTEMQILQSTDLARDVAEAYGAEKILAKLGGGKDVALAASHVRNGLSVFVPPSSTVLQLSFRHPDSDIVQPVLQTVVERYLKRHLEAHRSNTMLNSQQTQELESLKLRLNQTEDELRRAINAVGVISFDGTKDNLANQIMANRREVLGYEAEVAGRVAVLEELKKRLSAAAGSTPEAPVEPEIPLAVLEEHRRLALRVNSLRMLEQDLLSQYTPENIRVKNAQGQLAEVEATLEKLRQQHPRLTKLTPTQSSPSGPDFEANEAYAAAIQVTVYRAKIKELDAQHERLKAESAKLDRAEGNIMDLRRKKTLEEKQYENLSAMMEAQRFSDALAGSKVSNISAIQNPSPPFREPINTKKAGLFAVAGIIAGFAWAFLVELYLDRSVRRPADLTRMLRAPLFLTIPKLKLQDEKLALKEAENAVPADASGSTSLVPVGPPKRPRRASSLQPFHETLRDRLIGYFESRNLTHKPKLVAVTGLSEDAGVTTTAAGLARSLSETGEGKVLLVDMTVGEGAAKQFVKGREACGLDELLEARSQGHVGDNLYVVRENTNSNSERLSRNMPQRFARLIPKLKASDFDYIIFDMPTVSQLSITPRLAGFMDMVLLVVESESDDRDVVQSACSLLAESKAHVGVVLNKTRSYVPGRLNQELVST